MTAAAAEWKAEEIVKTYAVQGTTGPELYASIGEKGPVVGKSQKRTIAHTTFSLKWSRKYVPEGTTCRLVSAKPFLTLTYTLPKAAQALAEPTQSRWKRFADGIRAHEEYHGTIIKELVDQIIATTVGFTQHDDPKCQKIRKAIEAPLKAASDRHLLRSAEFDRMEMGSGGNVHQLVLGLVNGR